MLVVRLLQREGVVDAEQRVVVTFPAAEGMSGDEAARAYDRGHGGCAGGCRGYLIPSRGKEASSCACDERAARPCSCR